MREWIVSEEELGVDGAYYSGKELVRCKDCKYYWKNHKDGDSVPVCLASPSDDAFCSDGERKDDE